MNHWLSLLRTGRNAAEASGLLAPGPTPACKCNSRHWPEDQACSHPAQVPGAALVARCNGSVAQGLAREALGRHSHSVTTIFLKIFIVIQLQSSAFSPHPSTPPQPNPPPSPTSTLPLDFVHVSFIVAPVNPSPHSPRATVTLFLMSMSLDIFLNDEKS